MICSLPYFEEFQTPDLIGNFGAGLIGSNLIPRLQLFYSFNNADSSVLRVGGLIVLGPPQGQYLDQRIVAYR